MNLFGWVLFVALEISLAEYASSSSCQKLNSTLFHDCIQAGYNVTEFNPAITSQKELSGLIASMQSKFKNCSSLSALMTCSVQLPKCPTAASTLPCKDVCSNFVSECQNSASESDGLIALFRGICELLPSDKCLPTPNNLNNSASESVKCRRLTIRQCQHAGYNFTSVSGAYQQMVESSAIFQDSDANSTLRKIICMEIAPPCDAKNNKTLIVPCRSMCDDAFKESQSEFVKVFKAQEYCSAFPEFSDNTTVDEKEYCTLQAWPDNGYWPSNLWANLTTTGQQSTPPTMASKTTPLPAVNATTPAPTTSATAPAPTTSSTAPAPTTSATTPAPTTSATAPAPTTNATAPAPTTNATAPAPTTNATAPTPTSDTSKPVPTTNVTASVNVTTAKVTTPAATTNVTTPPPSTQGTTSASRTNVTTPSTPNVTTPAPSTKGTTPASTTNVTTPSTPNVTTPAPSTKGTTPTSTTNVTTPASTPNVTTPASTPNVTKPAPSTKESTPTSANVTTPAPTTKRTTPTSTANETKPASSTKGTAPATSTKGSTPSPKSSTSSSATSGMKGSTPPVASANKGGKMSAGAIAGTVLGILVLLLAIIVGAVFFRRYYRAKIQYGHSLMVDMDEL